MLRTKAHWPVVSLKDDWCGEHNLFGLTKLIDKRLTEKASEIRGAA